MNNDKGSGGDGGGDKGAKGAENQPTLEELSAKLDKISQQVDAGKQLSAEDESLLAELLAGGDEEDDSGKQKKSTQQGQSLEDMDLDKMSNKQLVGVVLEQVKGILSEFQQSTKKETETARRAAIDVQIKQEIKEVAAKYGDEFIKNKDKVIKVAAKNPELSVEDAFLLVQSKETRKQLSELKKKTNQEEDVVAGMVMKDGITGSDLVESVKDTKSIRDTARTIANRLGL